MAFTRKDFIKKYDTDIRNIALELDCDMGMAADIFCGACMHGTVTRGNDPEVVRALECIGDDSYYAGLQKEYLSAEDVEFLG